MSEFIKNTIIITLSITLVIILLYNLGIHTSTFNEKLQIIQSNINLLVSPSNQQSKVNHRIYKDIYPEPRRKQPLKQNQTLFPYKCETTCNPEMFKNCNTDFSKRQKLKPYTPSKKIKVPPIYWHGKENLETTNKLFNQVENFVNEYWAKQSQQNKILIPNPDKFNTKIPNVFHFTWFSCHDFKMMPMLAILSTKRFLSDNAKVVFNTDCEPENSWHYNEVKNVN